MASDILIDIGSDDIWEAITWTSADILSIRLLETIVRGIWSKIQQSCFKEMYWKCLQNFCNFGSGFWCANEQMCVFSVHGFLPESSHDARNRDSDPNIREHQPLPDGSRGNRYDWPRDHRWFRHTARSISSHQRSGRSSHSELGLLIGVTFFFTLFSLFSITLKTISPGILSGTLLYD